MAKQYNAESIEVLSGLEPVQKRPGMYTDTARPNHLAQEVIDNSVDEALAGHCKKIEVTLLKNGGLKVEDDGRGMPVDIHPEEGVSGVELILTKLHAGGKFSGDDYQFSGGLHGVGVSVVNALADELTVEVRRDAKVHAMTFANGFKTKELAVVGEVGRRNTGTTITFKPNKKYFDTSKFHAKHLQHLLRAKAILCNGLTVNFIDEINSTKDSWCFESGLEQYLAQSINGLEVVPSKPFSGSFSGNEEAVDWAVAWVLDGPSPLAESYVNLIPTIAGGTHVNGFRTGLLEGIREYCEFRQLVPKGLKLTGDDVWEGVSFVLSAKMRDPQFAGQTKEKLSSRQCAAFISGVVKDAFSLWLNQHTKEADQLAEWVIQNAGKRIRSAKKVSRKKVTSGPALPGKLADCASANALEGELFLVEGDSAGGSAKQARDRQFQAIMPLRGKIMNTWEVDSQDILASQEIHDIVVALGVDVGSDDLSKLRYGKICILADADSDGLHIATLLCALFVKHFRPLVDAGHVFVAMPPLYRIDVGKEVFYALDDDEKTGVLDRLAAEKKRATPNVQRFKGLGEMNPIQLRETTMDPDTRRLVQLTIQDDDDTDEVLDRLLAKKRSSDRKAWLEASGDLAEIL